ncbi:MAG: ABATE domain-containing protein [Anaerolineales bacterium]
MMSDNTLVKDWKFITEKLPLNFANTMNWHASAQPTEKLKSYSDLISWSWAIGLLDEKQAQYLLKEAENHPSETSVVLEKAIELREIIYRIFSAVANKKDPAKLDLTHIKEALIEALIHAKIVPTSNGFEWSWVGGKESFDCMLWPIAYSAVDILTSKDNDRVGQCVDDRGCGWLFFDTSRNHSRRWCMMEECGNRAKAHRHYQKQSKNKIG